MRHGRIDANHAEIVGALRGVGAHVQSLADLGRGVPDLLVGFRGRWVVIEVKGPRGKLTAAEQSWVDECGTRAPVHVVRSVDQALRVIGAG